MSLRKRPLGQGCHFGNRWESCGALCSVQTRVWALDAQVAGCGLGWFKSSHFDVPSPPRVALGAEAETAVGSCMDSSVRSGCNQELGLRGCGISPLHLGVDDTGILGEGAHR